MEATMVTSTCWFCGFVQCEITVGFSCNRGWWYQSVWLPDGLGVLVDFQTPACAMAPRAATARTANSVFSVVISPVSQVEQR
jgi:hypothetical protein